MLTVYSLDQGSEFFHTSGGSTLSVLNVLNNVEDTKLGPTAEPILEPSALFRAMQGSADSLFQTAPKLSVVAFGREHTYSDKLVQSMDEDPPRHCFIRDQSRDSNSSAPAATVAVAIDPKLVKYMVPISDMLDHKFEHR